MSDEPTVIARFEITFTRYLDKQGAVVRPLPGWATDPRALVPLYREMVITRAFDQKAIALQRTGQMGTYASVLGQEAVGVGVGSAMRKEDVLVPFYRDYATQFCRGVTMVQILQYWAGDERSMDFAPRRDFPICVPVGSQCPHAVGAAYALKLRREDAAVVCTMGDGATSKGDFYEAINAAGVMRVPLVFVILNNQWAISMPVGRQTAAATLAQKAVAAGFPGVQVDGNDVIAVRTETADALARARRGDGPTLIEALTYRLCDHTTADDASRYRSQDEVSAHWAEEPILRLRNHLVAIEAWSKSQEEALVHEAAEKVKSEVETYLALPKAGPELMFDQLYAKLPAPLVAQREEALAAKGGEAHA